MKSLQAAIVAEFLGTMILIILGDGVVGSAVLLDKAGGWVVITTGWALAVTIGVYVSGKVSGGHLNPAITLALAVRRGFPWDRVGSYCLAQIAGAFVGAAIVYVDYFEAFRAFEAAEGITRGEMISGKRLVRPPAVRACLPRIRRSTIWLSTCSVSVSAPWYW